MQGQWLQRRSNLWVEASIDFRSAQRIRLSNKAVHDLIIPRKRLKKRPPPKTLRIYNYIPYIIPMMFSAVEVNIRRLEGDFQVILDDWVAEIRAFQLWVVFLCFPEGGPWHRNGQPFHTSSYFLSCFSPKKRAMSRLIIKGILWYTCRHLQRQALVTLKLIEQAYCAEDRYIW